MDLETNLEIISIPEDSSELMVRGGSTNRCGLDLQLIGTRKIILEWMKESQINRNIELETSPLWIYIAKWGACL